MRGAAKRKRGRWAGGMEFQKERGVLGWEVGRCRGGTEGGVADKGHIDFSERRGEEVGVGGAAFGGWGGGMEIFGDIEGGAAGRRGGGLAQVRGMAVGGGGGGRRRIAAGGEWGTANKERRQRGGEPARSARGAFAGEGKGWRGESEASIVGQTRAVRGQKRDIARVSTRSSSSGVGGGGRGNFWCRRAGGGVSRGTSWRRETLNERKRGEGGKGEGDFPRVHYSAAGRNARGEGRERREHPKGGERVAPRLVSSRFHGEAAGIGPRKPTDGIRCRRGWVGRRAKSNVFGPVEAGAGDQAAGWSHDKGVIQIATMRKRTSSSSIRGKLGKRCDQVCAIR